MRVPINIETCLFTAAEDEKEDESSLEPWEWWDAFRSAANYEKKLGLVLELGKGMNKSSVMSVWSNSVRVCSFCCLQSLPLKQG